MSAAKKTRSQGTHAPAERVHRRGAMALAFQETLTATVRLRTQRQSATDAEAFRAHVKQLLSGAHEEARRAGYGGDDAKLAVYAVVVFLDEAVLNSPHPTFAEWPRRPLQEELFGGHMGGEAFFQNLHGLLGREDSDDLADLIEVHQLCLLLGFRGRYGTPGHDELRGWIRAAADRIARIRGASNSLSPSWAPPEDEVIPLAKDRMLVPLTVVAGAALLLAAALSVVYWLAQHSWITQLTAGSP